MVGENIVPIVFTFDENYAAGASVAIQSLLANKKSNTQYEIYVIYGNMSENVKKKLEKFHPIRWLKVDTSTYQDLAVTERYNIACWYILSIPELLKDIPKVIYSDVDCLFLCDLAELFRIDLHDKCVGAVKECHNLHDRECSNLMGDIIYIADISVLNLDRMREVNSTQYMIDAARKVGVSPSMQMDIFNIAAKNEIVPIPLEYAVPDFVYHRPAWLGYSTEMYSAREIFEAREHAKRIHYSADSQPCKIWEWPPEEIPLEYLQYLVKTGLYKHGISLEG